MNLFVPTFAFPSVGFVSMDLKRSLSTVSGQISAVSSLALTEQPTRVEKGRTTWNRVFPVRLEMADT